MRISLTTFWLPKDGNSDKEYEDAFWPGGAYLSKEILSFRCAVADGATETSFSGDWAKMLCHHYCIAEEPSSAWLLDTLPRLQQQWQQDISIKTLPWFAEEKARHGAFSSIVGLSLTEQRVNGDFSLNWEALAVGDSCLLHVREGMLSLRFPLERSEEFDNSPYLIGSTVPLDEARVQSKDGVCQPGDTFYLMTDALACWFLRGHEKRGAECLHWLEVKTLTDFETMVKEERRAQEEGRFVLRNDDVTLLRLQIEAST